MNSEKFQTLYKNIKKEEIIEELYFKCRANYELVSEKEKLASEVERLKISLAAQEEITMNEYRQKKQLENIIKEARKTLINSKEYKMAKELDLTSKMSILIKLLEILDKAGVDKIGNI